MSYFRWLIAYFVGLALIPATPMLAVGLDAVLHRALCPPPGGASAMCRAAWGGGSSVGAFVTAFALGAAAFVALPTWIAPSNRQSVAKATFLLMLAMAGLALLLTVLAMVSIGPMAKDLWLGVVLLIATCVIGAALTRWWVLRTLPPHR